MQLAFRGDIPAGTIRAAISSAPGVLTREAVRMWPMASGTTLARKPA